MLAQSKPQVKMSDNGTNFVGASRELKDLCEFLQSRDTEVGLPQFCVTERIQWEFIPERAPHFGGVWEAMVKSMKIRLQKVHVFGNHTCKFTF